MKENHRIFTKLGEQKRALLKRSASLAAVAAIIVSCNGGGDNSNSPEEIRDKYESSYKYMESVTYTHNSEIIPLAMYTPFEFAPLQEISPSARAVEVPITTTPTPIIEPSPTMTPTPEDRNNCGEIRGTEYNSQSEREMFLENCITPTPIPSPTPVEQQTEPTQAEQQVEPTPQSLPQTAQTTSEGYDIGVFSISGYYCTRVVGYPGYDSGGFCSEGASGLGTIAGQTVACGPSWPFGTVFEIEGYGRVVCTDRGGAVHDSHLDIYFDTDQQLRNSGIPSSAPVRVVPR